jgi:hypothetical protein
MEGVSSATETRSIPFVGMTAGQLQVETWGRKTSRSAHCIQLSNSTTSTRYQGGATPGNGDKAVSF